MTCPHCGARNTADAPWCTQCLEPLTTADPPAPPEAAPPGAQPSDAPLWGTPAPATPAASPSAGEGPDRAFRSVDGRVEWCCAACETWNDLDVPVCVVCGQRLGTSVTGAGATTITERVGRARPWLWSAAAVGVVLMVASIVLLVAALRSGTG